MKNGYFHIEIMIYQLHISWIPGGHAPQRENLEKSVQSGASWCIFLSDFALKLFFKVISLYRTI